MSLCVVAVLVSLAVKWSVTYNSYSGENDPPMFGDYEAQRHWMEITYNLPVKEWYFNSTDNNLSYWGLDYPPLTAYHSFICGYISNLLNPDWVALHTSRGYESKDHKLFMRYTVLVADLLIYLPAVVAFVHSAIHTASSSRMALLCGIMMIYPGLVLVDYGHFQYNCISLGFTLWAIVFIYKKSDYLASFFFVLALNYKQMELYHSLPFFFYLLGVCISQRTWLQSLRKLICLGVVVIVTMAICWLPFLGDKDAILQVLHRIFPFARGLYEDKVANVWCALAIIIKFKQILPGDLLLKLCSVSTLLCCLPSSINLLCRPSPKRFLFSLVNCSLAFFLFSYQVHEKSILLPALPVCLLLPSVPVAATWFLVMSVFSMFPLLSRDGQLSSYIVLTLLFIVLSIVTFKEHFHHAKVNAVILMSFLGILVLHCLAIVLPPPRSLPDLYPVLISMYSCGHFVLFILYFNWLQLFNLSTVDDKNMETKKIN